MATLVKQVPKLKDCSNMDLRSDPNALAVMKKPIPLKAFGEDAGLHSRKNTEYTEGLNLQGTFPLIRTESFPHILVGESI